MKKIIGAIAILLVLFGGYKAYQYYDETYNSQTAYAKTPEAIPPRKDAVDANGKKMWDWKSYNYELTFVTSNGQKIKLPYSVESENPTPFEPNSYVKAEVSQKRVTSGPTAVAKETVPENILSKLQ